MASDSIKIHIGAKDAASAVIQGVQARTIALGVAIGNLASKAIVGMLNGMREWVSEALEAEKANVMIEASLRGVGQYTPELAKQYRDLANAIQDETGASDESVKANIALLVSMGVMPGKMEAAARGVQALSAMHVEGSMAAKAMARALEGDMAAFDRLSPAVRLANTETEKAAAIAKFVGAGFEQQKASLQTVGGAWEALKGRIGDAREDIIGAIFEGLKLGTTFDTMQASVGRFLKSDAFAGFTTALRNGAGYALEIAKAMTQKEGKAGVAEAFGNVIKSAIRDGAEYMKAAILSAFKGDPNKVTPLKEARVGLAKMFGTPEDEARNTVYGGKDRFGHAGGDEYTAALPGAVAALDAALESARRETVKASDYAETFATAMEANAAAEQKDGQERKASADLEAQLTEAGLKAKKAAATAAEQKELTAIHTQSLEDQIVTYAEREKTARQNIATWTERRAALVSQSISSYIANAKDQREAVKEMEKSDKGDDKRAARLTAARDRGDKLSRVNGQWLYDYNDKKAITKQANEQIGINEKAAARALAEKNTAAAELKAWQASTKRNLERIANSIDGELEVAN